MEMAALPSSPGARGDRCGHRHALAADGHAVAVADLNLAQAEEAAATITAAGGKSVAIGIDITDSEGVAAGLAAVTDQLGPVSVLVNNAGWDELRPFVETDEAFWERCSTSTSRARCG